METQACCACFPCCGDDSVAMVVPRCQPPAAPQMATNTSTGLTGIVKSATGHALDGIAVSVQADGSNITTSVYTDEEGRYYFPPLKKGHYQAWAQTIGYQAARAQLDIDSTKAARQDFTLQTLKDFSRQLTSPEWLAALPDATPADQRMKMVYRNTCDGCHPADFVLQNRFDRTGWEAILKVMGRIGVTGDAPVMDAAPQQLSYVRHYKEDLATYLAKARGPNSDLKFKLLPRPHGDAAQVVVTEYSLTSSEDTSKPMVSDGAIWEEGVPSAYDSRGPHDAEVDPHGMVWIADAQYNPVRTVSRLNPETGEVTNFMLPSARNKGMSMGSHGITVDKNGIAWFNADDGLGRIDTNDANPRIDRIVPPADMVGVGGNFCADPKGNVWSPHGDGVIRYEPETKKFTVFDHPVAGGGTYGLGCDAEGNAWWTQFSGTHFDVLGKSDVETGKSIEVALTPVPFKKELFTKDDMDMYRLAGAGVNTVPPWAQGPRRLNGDTVGNMWVADWWGNNLAKVDTRTNKVVKYYPFPSAEHVGVYTTQIDKNGMVWVCLMNSEALASFDPKTEKWTLYPFPSRGNEDRYIAVDNYKPRVEVWVPSSRTNRMLRMQFRTKEEMQQLKASLSAQK